MHNSTTAFRCLVVSEDKALRVVAGGLGLYTVDRAVGSSAVRSQLSADR